MRLLLTIGCAASILAVGGTDFSTIPWLVRGASLTLRHSAEPQAPGITSHAEISGVSTTPPAFTVTMKHNQNNFIGGAVLPREGFFDFSGHTVLACEIENLSEWPVDVMLRIQDILRQSLEFSFAGSDDFNAVVVGDARPVAL